VVSFHTPAYSSSTDVRIVTDEADAVLAILARRKSSRLASDGEWRRLFSSEGYVRLKKREAAMKVPYSDEEFRTFVLSDTLAARTALLEETLAKWKLADMNRAVGRALAYLPPGTRIQAKVYPVIKPKGNSFVFDVDTDPAIFLYVDPEVTHEQFENTLAHELHHIGYGSGCSSKRKEDEVSKLPQNIRNVAQWLGAFGEGFAMLAAAGGPEFHPHAASKRDDRERWDRDVANFNEDLKKVEGFFLDVLNGRLDGDELRNRGFSFFGIQGPWYTVGWKMAVTIEKVYGRARLIDCMCDQRKLLSTYNEAALKQSRASGEQLALWSQPLVRAVKGGIR
jgi:hypothetical protein